MHNKGPKSCRRLLVWGLLCVLHGGNAGAQRASCEAELQNLASHAATIFVGQLVAIERKGDVVEVHFRVEQPVRGNAGATVVLHEWGGSWAPGQTRYVVGMRVLAFLHGTSEAGLSSPVHGAEGLVPVVVQGANAPQLLDIRRVASSVVRAPGTPLPTEAQGAVPLSEALRLVAGGGTNALGRLPLPVHGRPPVDLLPASGPIQTTTGEGMRPGRWPTFSPVEGSISDAHR